MATQSQRTTTGLGTSETLSVYSSPQPVQCRVCNTRGGCVAAWMMNTASQANLVRTNNRVLSRGEHLFREGSECAAFYVVKSGSVKSYLITEDGEEQVLGFYMLGDVLGLDGLGIDGRMSSAVALETTSVCRLPFEKISHRGSGQRFLKLMSDQMARDHNLVLMLAKKDADSRLASFLLDLSQRFKLYGYSYRVFNLSMGRQDIGNYLGLAIETVSRSLARFQEAGLLAVRRRKIEICDLSSLRAIAGAQAPH